MSYDGVLPREVTAKIAKQLNENAKKGGIIGKFTSKRKKENQMIIMVI